MDSSTLSSEQLYELNDVLTHTLASFGWSVRDEDDAEKLNDAVHTVADTFFPNGNRASEPMFKPSDRVVVFYDRSGDTHRAHGLFWMMDETGLMLKARYPHQAALTFIPAERLVMIESEETAA